MITAKDSLLYGVEYKGQRHYDFEMRLPTVDDNIAAVEQAEGPASGLRLEAVMYSRALLSLGSIPKEEITPKVVGALAPEDLDILAAAVQDIKKKLLRPRPDSDPSGSQSSPSAASAFPSPPSGP